MDALLGFLIYVAATVVIGCLWGLIPFFLGRYRYRPNMGKWGLIWCGVAGPFLLSFLVMLGFVIAVLVSERDFRPPQPQPQPPATAPGRSWSGYGRQPAGRLTVTCLSGPLKGQVYQVGDVGLMLGRDTDCAVHFPPDTAGISRHHCAVRWQQGVPVLVDLNSGYGTFLGDGRQLPPNYPVTVGPGTRFYLATPEYLFQFSV